MGAPGPQNYIYGRYGDPFAGLGTPIYMNGVPITIQNWGPHPQIYIDMGTIPISMVDIGTPDYIKNFVLCYSYGRAYVHQ